MERVLGSRKIKRVIVPIVQAQIMIDEIIDEKKENMLGISPDMVNIERYSREIEACKKLEEATELCTKLTELLDSIKNLV